MLGSFRDGFLNFYDTTLPFRRSDFPLMHADVLLAIFGFALAAGILIAARRPIGAAVVLVVGVGWPTTLVPGSRPLLVGALALVGVLAVLFLLRSGTHPARGLAQGFAVALVLVVVAAVASTSGSVAKGAFLTWQRLGSVRPARRPRRRPLRLELALPRDPLPEEEDHGAEGQDGGREEKPLLARDDARRLHGHGLAGVPRPGHGVGLEPDRLRQPRGSSGRGA